MNALRMAQDAINQADHIRNADRWGDEMQEAQTYAAIAQAEQLKRIADALISTNKLLGEVLIAIDTKSAESKRIACALEYIANAQVALAAAAYGAYPSSPYPNLKQIYEEEPPESDAMGGQPGYEDLPY